MLLRLRPSGASTDEPRRWRVPTAVFVLTIGLTVALAMVVVVRERRAQAAALAAEGRATTLAIEAAVDEAFKQEQAIVALYHASETVTVSEFESFMSDIGYTPGMFGIGIIAMVEHDELVAFETQLAIDHPGSFVFQLDGLMPIPSDMYDIHYPIQYFEPPEHLPAWGFDVASDPTFAKTLEQSIALMRPVASPLLSFPGRPGVDGVVLFKPVTDSHGDFVGVAAAALDLSDLLAAVLPEGRAQDWGAVVVDAASLPPLPESGWVGEITVGDRRWLVLLEDPGGSSLLVGGVIGLAGLLTAAALAFSLSVLGGRLRQRREMERLRALDRQKDDFLATVSHELRTPLTSVMGFVEELIAAPANYPQADRREMMGIVADEAHAMEGIVQDLLAAARLQQGSGLPVVVQRVPDLVAEVSSLAIGRHIARVIAVHPGDTAVAADPTRLRQILRNLLENAVRHGKPPVEITVARHGKNIDLEISDHGSGVDPEVRSKVFDRYRSSQSDTGQPSSTGIGLWLSRELARLMGGDLTLTKSPGGAVFVLTLPAADPVMAAGF